MSDDNKYQPGSDATLPPEQRLQEVLQARWDPGKLSSFMRSSQQSIGTRLDMSQRSRFERRLGVDLGDVRIYTGELAEEITKAHSAEALTIGSTGMILMRQSSMFAPGSAAGTALLAHELTHVAQGRDSAISFKKTSRDLAHEDLSEAEAEAHERQVLHEETTGRRGHGGGGKGGGGGADAQERKRKLLEKVLLLHEEHQLVENLRKHGH